MPLFNAKTVAAALATFDRAPTEAERAAAARWAAQARVDFNGQNESQLEPEFNAHIMQATLGYRAQTPDAPGTIKAKQPVGAGTVDLAIGAFTASEARVLAPVELKGPRTALDAIMPGRAKTPVQQAWEYANDAVGARWVVVCNMRVLRLYAVGHGRAAHEEFDLRRLDDAGELKRLQLFLHADRLLGGATTDLLARSAREDRDITNALYRDYRSLRDDLLQFACDSRPQVGAEERITLVQKLLDRLVFIAFAEDSVLIPDSSIRNAVTFQNPYDPQPKWVQVRRLFSAVDNGYPPSLGIPPYNGGLFAPDAALDALDLPDHLVERFLDIAKYDFKSEVSVTILGHIFEQSITDIEALRAEARGEAPPKATTRKRFGVVYTPEFVTRFIVEHTIGLTLAEAREALLATYADGEDAGGAVLWRGADAERAYWSAYLERLTSLRIVDPACGSGAFLLAAFDFLHAEQRRVRDRLGALAGGLFDYAAPNSDVEIITANLHGVDVNAESVEITKLALWLKTAKRGRALESLDLNIRCGDSLIEDSSFTHRRFVWRDAFPQIFPRHPRESGDPASSSPEQKRDPRLRGGDGEGGAEAGASPILPVHGEVSRAKHVTEGGQPSASSPNPLHHPAAPDGPPPRAGKDQGGARGATAPPPSATPTVPLPMNGEDQAGFDIVLGNPPYVRMELLKPTKPYLERRYAVVSDRADLYAYFFELGLRVLRPGGRLGYISSSTFFRTGSGAPLRRHLGEVAALEAVVDFGDLQVFDGVTTYPAILTMQKAGAGVEAGEGALRFLNLKTVPADLSAAFEEQAEPMPRARLTGGSWRFEGDRLDAIRARMAAGRRTLAQVYGAPLYGIKTGLNEAFVLSRAQRDALVARDPRSAELLKPFLVGENLKRWRVESDDLWLIYTPRNRVDIEAYPAVRDWLLPFRAKLEARATKQEWWELQQAQAAYAGAFDGPKIIYPHFNDKPNFSFITDGSYSNDKSYVVPAKRPLLAGLLNSRALWLQLVGLAPAVRGGFYEARVQYVGALHLPDGGTDLDAVLDPAERAGGAARERETLLRATLHRLADLHPAIETTAAFRAWPDLSFGELRALLAKRFRGHDIPLAERDEWERWYEARRAEAATLRARIASAEAEINDRVYRLFALAPDEIAAIEDALAGQY